MRRLHRILIGRFLFAAALVLIFAAPAYAVFPAVRWETRTPGELGLDASRLAAFRAAVGGSGAGVVVYDGYLVYSWGDPSQTHEWGSATKPLFSTLLAFAVRDGLVGGLDDTIDDLGWNLQPADRAITFRQLSNGTSGYALPESPGAAFAYNDYAIKLLTLSLLNRVEGVPASQRAPVEALIQALDRLGPLQFEDEPIIQIVSGAPRFHGSPRDFARIGWFWQQRCVWNGQPLLPAGLVGDLIRPQVPDALGRAVAGPVSDYLQVGTSGGGVNQTRHGPGILGMGWWFNPDRRTWPDAPADTYQANGHWNRSVLTVIPSRRLVAAWTGGLSSSNPDTFTTPMNALLKPLAEAVPPPECDDGLDNDGNGHSDFPGDPRCVSVGDRERGGCGLGFELALLLPALRRLRRAPATS